ncbi:hypothetical protein BKA93DRAFT_735908 [Sparassis latifolia]
MSNGSVSFLPSQVDAPVSTRPLTTSASPFDLLYADIVLFFQNWRYLPGIVLPLTPTPSGPLDELYPSVANLWAISVHVVLIVIEGVYILSIPLSPFFVNAAFIAYSGTVLIIVYMICFLLNKGVSGEFVFSDERLLEGYEKRDGEVWVFVNGVAVGKHWLKSNVNRLSETFRRRIIGVHNPTGGIIFDVIQCLIQRDFSYDTPDVRQSYAYLKTALLDQSVHKVVFLAHSQGGIIASMALDWLYAELPAAALSKLEVYTFGCAANHFNNPARRASHVHPYDRQPNGTSPPAPTNGHTPHDARIVPHIEHYANGRDFVSRWGVLHFAASACANRFAGRVFEQRGASGHQLDQHYLDTMFPLDAARTRVREENAFMDAPCEVDAELVAAAARTMRVKELSRLWLYRNGEVPEHIPASPVAN